MAEKALLSLEYIVNSLMSKILPVLRLLSFTTIKGFLLRYITPYLNCFRNGMPDEFESLNKVSEKNVFHYTSRFRHFILDLEFQELIISKPVQVI